MGRRCADHRGDRLSALSLDLLFTIEAHEGRCSRSAGLRGLSAVGSVRCDCCTLLLHMIGRLTFHCQIP